MEGVYWRYSNCQCLEDSLIERFERPLTSLRSSLNELLNELLLSFERSLTSLRSRCHSFSQMPLNTDRLLRALKSGVYRDFALKEYDIYRLEKDLADRKEQLARQIRDKNDHERKEQAGRQETWLTIEWIEFAIVRLCIRVLTGSIRLIGEIEFRHLSGYGQSTAKKIFKEGTYQTLQKSVFVAMRPTRTVKGCVFGREIFKDANGEIYEKIREVDEGTKQSNRGITPIGPFSEEENGIQLHGMKSKNDEKLKSVLGKILKETKAAHRVVKDTFSGIFDSFLPIEGQLSGKKIDEGFPDSYTFTTAAVHDAHGRKRHSGRKTETFNLGRTWVPRGFCLKSLWFGLVLSLLCTTNCSAAPLFDNSTDVSLGLERADVSCGCNGAVYNILPSMRSEIGDWRTEYAWVPVVALVYDKWKDLEDTGVLSISIIGYRLTCSCINLTTRHVPFADTPPEIEHLAEMEHPFSDVPVGKFTVSNAIVENRFSRKDEFSSFARQSGRLEHFLKLQATDSVRYDEAPKLGNVSKLEDVLKLDDASKHGDAMKSGVASWVYNLMLLVALVIEVKFKEIFACNTHGVQYVGDFDNWICVWEQGSVSQVDTDNRWIIIQIALFCMAYHLTKQRKSGESDWKRSRAAIVLFLTMMKFSGSSATRLKVFTTSIESTGKGQGIIERLVEDQVSATADGDLCCRLCQPTIMKMNCDRYCGTPCREETVIQETLEVKSCTESRLCVEIMKWTGIFVVIGMSIAVLHLYFFTREAGKIEEEKTTDTSLQPTYDRSNTEVHTDNMNQTSVTNIDGTNRNTMKRTALRCHLIRKDIPTKDSDGNNSQLILTNKQGNDHETRTSSFLESEDTINDDSTPAVDINRRDITNDNTYSKEAEHEFSDDDTSSDELTVTATDVPETNLYDFKYAESINHSPIEKRSTRLKSDKRHCKRFGTRKNISYKYQITNASREEKTRGSNSCIQYNFETGSYRLKLIKGYKRKRGQTEVVSRHKKRKNAHVTSFTDEMTIQADIRELSVDSSLAGKIVPALMCTTLALSSGTAMKALIDSKEATFSVGGNTNEQGDAEGMAMITAADLTDIKDIKAVEQIIPNEVEQSERIFSSTQETLGMQNDEPGNRCHDLPISDSENGGPNSELLRNINSGDHEQGWKTEKNIIASLRSRTMPILTVEAMAHNLEMVKAANKHLQQNDTDKKVEDEDDCHALRRAVWLSHEDLPIPSLDLTVAIVHSQAQKILERLARGEHVGAHESMKYEILRVCTYRNYPGEGKPFRIQMAGAGWYFASDGDEVVCYCCGLRKSGWQEIDNPMKVHELLRPTCDFLVKRSEVNIPVPELSEVQAARFNIFGSTTTDTESSSRQGEGANNYDAESSSPQNRLPPPKHPQYAELSVRLETFRKWPTNIPQTAQIMAECGYYYAGFGDCVRCYHCGIGLRHWTEDDYPWVEHARWSKDCAYLRHMKGDEFVQNVHLAIDNDEEPEDLVPETPSGRPADMSQATPNEDSNQLLLTDQAQSVLTMGYQPRIIKRAIDIILHNEGKSGITAQKIMETIFMLEERDEARNQQEDATSHLQEGLAKVNISSASGGPDTPLKDAANTDRNAATGQSHGKTHSQGNGKTKNDKKKDAKPPSKGTRNDKEESKKSPQNNDEASAHANEGATEEKSKVKDTSKIKAENRKLKEQTVCKICLDKPVSIVFLPCGHLVTCAECAPAMRKCPICRALVKGRVKAFMS